MPDLQIRNTEEADLDYILDAENSDENRRYIIPWSRAMHLQAIDNPDIAHLIVQAKTNVQAETNVQAKTNVGYVILAGLLDPNQSIEFRRIVVTDKGKGYGKAVVAIIKELVFNTYKAHRLWLDVKLQNHRAQAIYSAAGFVVEGTLRECLKSGDEYESLIVMSILQHEYESKFN